MREGDAAAIAERLGSYNRTSSTEVPRFTRIGRADEAELPKPAKKVGTCSACSYVFKSCCTHDMTFQVLLMPAQQRPLGTVQIST